MPASLSSQSAAPIPRFFPPRVTVAPHRARRRQHTAALVLPPAKGRSALPAFPPGGGPATPGAALLPQRGSPFVPYDSLLCRVVRSPPPDWSLPPSPTRRREISPRRRPCFPRRRRICISLRPHGGGPARPAPIRPVRWACSALPAGPLLWSVNVHLSSPRLRRTTTVGEDRSYRRLAGAGVTESAEEQEKEKASV